MDSVNNRSLFQKRSTAARDKVRQMGGIQQPQGILASFQELMQVAGRDRTQNLAPQMMQQPQMPTMQQPMMQPQPQQMPMMQPQQQPARFQDGGPVEPSFAERFGQNTMSSLGVIGDIFSPARRQAQAGVQGFDIAATPTPRARVEVPDIATMVKQNIGDNPEAQEKFTQLENALTDPNADDEARKAAITDAAGVENTREGLRDVVTQITGREQPASATVDELNRAISGVALGGAIGGPRSVAARISEALLFGLQAKRETAVGRERFEQEIAVAGAKARPDTPKEFLETPRGKAAIDLYQTFIQTKNRNPEDAYMQMDRISPGLGEELKAAMSPAPAAAPATVDLYPDSPRPEDADQMLELAREAITTGNKNAAVVKEMLSDMGINPAEL